MPGFTPYVFTSPGPSVISSGLSPNNHLSNSLKSFSNLTIGLLKETFMVLNGNPALHRWVFEERARLAFPGYCVEFYGTHRRRPTYREIRQLARYRFTKANSKLVNDEGMPESGETGIPGTSP